MSTRAERFRYEAERTGPKRAPRPPKHPNRRATHDTGALNRESHATRPSRKSSRSGANHGKNSTVLEYVARVLRSFMPRVRHERGSS